MKCLGWWRDFGHNLFTPTGDGTVSLEDVKEDAKNYK